MWEGKRERISKWVKKKKEIYVGKKERERVCKWVKIKKGLVSGKKERGRISMEKKRKD